MAQPVAADRTPLYEEHLRLGAQMTTFSGWTMPLKYTSIREEHLAVRQAAGLFDLSHMGEITARGETAQALVQRLVTRDIGKLVPGRAKYAVLCNESGGIIDDLLVYADRAGYFLIVNAGNQDRDYQWVRAHAEPATVVRDTGRERALIGIQGPRALELVERLADQALADTSYYAFVEGKVAGIPALISRTGYTGEDGFEIFCPVDAAVSLWRSLLEAGKDWGLMPAGLGARDTLRLEAAMRLYGNDIDETVNPLEAGLAWAVSLEKDFVGRAALVAAKEQGLSRTFVGVKMLDRSIPRHGYRVLHQGRPVGAIASGNVSFTLGYNIGTAYVPPAVAQPGTGLEVEVRGQPAPAEVVPLPFYTRPHPQ